MAIYHCSIKIISRGKGKSAVAAAAYRAGKKIVNNYDGITHDYTRKGGIIHAEILLPEHAPKEYTDRAVLWNAVEKIEKAKNSQLAREIELVLPKELTPKQNISLVRDYISRHFVSAGMCADICVHDKNDGNPHAHVMLTMRPFEPDGTWGAKSRKEYVLDDNGERVKLKNGTFKTYKIDLMNWNDQTKAEEWRAAWADAVNAVLEQQNISERVDHRSYEWQGIEQVPTVHMGVAATQMEKRGIKTERGNQNREISRMNQILFAVLAKLKQLKDWLKEAVAPTSPPTFASVLRGVLEGKDFEIQYGQIRDFKKATRVLTFMQENNISTLPKLRGKACEDQAQVDNTRENLKFYDRRLSTLDEHIRQRDIYLRHRDLFAEYQTLKPRKKPKFFEEHRAELMVFEAAARHFKEHHIDTDFSLTAWKTAREKLAAERGNVHRRYHLLKENFEEAYTIYRAAEQIACELNPPPPQKNVRKRTWER